MSDLGFRIRAPRLPFSALPGSTGFRADTRFCPSSLAATPVEESPAEEPPIDAVSEAYAQGIAEGRAQALAEAAAATKRDAEAREGLTLAFARLDQTLEEELRLRLGDTVTALCEAALAPLALDQEAFARRVAKAAAMLARAEDERVIRLHPEDIALVSDRLCAEWAVEPDATLERGAIRVDGASGGVEDGPSTWRLTIAEALRHC